MRFFSRALVAALVLGAAFGCNGISPGGGGDPDTGDRPAPAPTPRPDPDRVSYGDLDIALHVEDVTGFDREEPVRSGIPLPRVLDLKETAHLQILDENGEPVPAQFRVTSRWSGDPDDPGKAIKWLLADFDAKVPASSGATYRLRTVTPAPDRTGSLVAENSAARIVIDTGAARFTLSKTAFDLFDSVQLAGGATLVPPGSDKGIYLQLPNGSRLLAANGTTGVSVEEDGPLHAVVVARGRHAAPGGGGATLDWTVRLQFHRGRAESLVAYTFTDRDLPSIGGFTALDEVGISLPIAPGLDPRWTLGGVPATGALSAEIWQRQAGNLSPTMARSFDPGNADTIGYQNGGAAAGNGGRGPGWIDVTGADGGVTAAVRWYWQQYPKKLAARPGRLDVELWPSEDSDLRVYAGAQKTHEVLYVFHPKPARGASNTGDAAARRLADPLFARCNPSWYASSWVWNRLGVFDQAAYADPSIADRYFTNLFEVEFEDTFVSRRFDSGGNGHAYSMWDFGDGRDGNGVFANAAYDTPRSLFLNWAVTGNRDLLDRGMEAALHLRDVDIEHSPLNTRNGIISARGVPQPWLGRTRYNPAQGPQTHDLGFQGATGFGFEHSKGQGLADHYFLTGDGMSKEVLAETYQYYRQWLVDAASGYLRTGGSRTVGHMLLIVLGYHDAFGGDEARSRADYIVGYLDDWQRETSPNDPDGWMWNDGGDSTSTFMNAVTAEALMLYEVNFPERLAVRANLVDAARWTVDPANGQLEYSAGRPYFNAWTNDNYGVSHATVLDAMVGPWLGYASAATRDPQYVDLAKDALVGCIEADTSSSFMKSFTQQTRLVPAFLWYLQTEEAQQPPRG